MNMSVSVLLVAPEQFLEAQADRGHTEELSNPLPGSLVVALW